MSLNESMDIGARIRARTAIGNTALSQTSDTAATSDTGVTIDRQESGLSHYYSCKAIVSGMLLSGSSEQTGSLAIEMQHSSDGTSWDDFSTATNPSAVEWGSTAGAANTTAGTQANTVEQRANLIGARRYIRVNLDAPTYSGSSSGTILSVAGVVVFGGADENPAA